MYAKVFKRLLDFVLSLTALVVLSPVMLVLTVVAHILFYGADEDTLGNLCLIVTGVQLAFLIGSIFPTQWALKRTFNEDGTRK